MLSGNIQKVNKKKNFSDGSYINIFNYVFYRVHAALIIHPVHLGTR